MKNKSPLPRLLIGIILTGALIAAFKYLPVTETLKSIIEWVEGLGFWAPIIFMIVYATGVILFVPSSVLSAAAGTIFGAFWGTVYVSIAATIGATIAFLLGRYLARNWIEKRIEGNQTFAAIDKAVASQGWKIVGLTRLSPIFPFSLINYAYGLTKVKFTHFVLATWIGMLPITMIIVCLGSICREACQSEGKTLTDWLIYAAAIGATIAVSIFITRIDRKALDDATSE